MVWINPHSRAVAVSHYVRAAVIPRSVVWAALLAVCYGLTVVATSAGTAVAVSMVLGRVTAALFGALIAVQAKSLKLNPADG
jgi:Mg/Co/Ni transporter MgtE